MPRSSSPVSGVPRFVRRPLARWRQRLRTVGRQRHVWSAQWRAERDLERVVLGDHPILVGPWCSEVGYEVLYWVPFLRWVMAAYRVAPERVTVMSRGGAAPWYEGLSARYVDAFEFVSPDDLARRAQAGTHKQIEPTAFDDALGRRAAEALGLQGMRQLHPALLFRWLGPYWSGHETLGFAERHTRHARIAPPTDLPCPSLPDTYVAVKLYAARALPDTAQVRAQVDALLSALAERLPVVLLETGFDVDEHADWRVASGTPVIRVRDAMTPRINLALQTQIIGGAKLFVGTCGSLAWLAPLLGVTTIALFTDPSFLHAHLHFARRAYGRLDAGAFHPTDLGGLIAAGLGVTARVAP